MLIEAGQTMTDRILELPTVISYWKLSTLTTKLPTNINNKYVLKNI